MSPYSDFPPLKARENPVGIIVTPTIGLAANIVSTLKEDFGISAFAWCHDTVAEARRGPDRDLFKEISPCEKYSETKNYVPSEIGLSRPPEGEKGKSRAPKLRNTTKLREAAINNTFGKQRPGPEY
ncbi:hypothetical protein C8J56DRAFT_880498 [Mycena floridula]|nr:hypothetical protein C8J56DRAFT_880498 [Mycena floridula]